MKRTIPVLNTLLAIMLVAIFLIHAPVQAADCTWVGGTGDWSDSANWSGCDGGVPGAGDTAVINDGEVTISGDISVAGLTFSGGVLDGPGTGTTLTVTDSLLLDGGEKSLARLTLVNEGSGQWTAGNWRLRLPGGGSTWGQFQNAGGATFEIAGGVGLINSSSADVRFFNHGTLIKSGSGLANLHSGFVGMLNQGLVDVQQGELRLPGGGSSPPHEGGFTVAAGARIEFDGHLHHFGPTASISGTGEVRFPFNGNWTLQPGMTYSIAGVTRLRDANSCPCSLIINTDAETGVLVMGPGGTGTNIQGQGSLTVNDNFDWHTGGIGLWSVMSNFSLNLLGDALLHTGPSVIERGITVHNHGDLVYSGGQFYIAHSSASLINHPDATIEIQGERVIDYRFVGSSTPHGLLDNRGSLIKTGGETAEIVSITIENSGEIDVQAGQLRFVRSSFLSQSEQGGARLILNDGVLHSEEPLIFENSQLRGQGTINADVESNNYLWPGFTLDENEPGFYEAGILEIDGGLTMTDTTRTFAFLVSSDPQPGIGYSQLQVNSAVELHGMLSIRIDNDNVNGVKIGDEFAIMTCAQGCTGSFDTIDVWPEDFSFEVFYQGNQVVIRSQSERAAEHTLYLPLVIRP